MSAFSLLPTFQVNRTVLAALCTLGLSALLTPVLALAQVPETDVSAALSGPSDAVQNDIVTYTARLVNNGPVEATNATFSLSAPTGFTYHRDGSSFAICSENAGVVTCSMARMDVGATAEIDVAFTVTENACNTTVTPEITVSADQTDSNDTNNTASTQTAVTCPVPEADMRMIGVGFNSTVNAGDTATFDWDFENRGPDPATRAILTITVDDPSLYDSLSLSNECTESSSGTIICELGTLAKDARGSLPVSIATKPDTCNEQLALTAVISAQETDPDSNGNQMVVETTMVCPTVLDADLFVGTGGPAAANHDDTVTYTVDTYNNGPAAASNVLITMPIPDELAFDPTRSSDECQVAGNVIRCTDFDLDVNEARELTVTLSIPEFTRCDETIYLDASVQSDQDDPYPNNNSAASGPTVIDCPSLSADLRIRSAGAEVVMPGSRFNYLLTVEKVSSADVDLTIPEVRVRYPYLHSALRFNDSQSTDSCTEDPLLGIVCSIQNFTGQREEVDIVFDVPGDAQCDERFGGRASILSSTYHDPNPANNESNFLETRIHCASQADLTAHLSTLATEAQAGADVAFTYTLRNNGPETITNAEIKGIIPSGTTFNAAQSDTDCRQEGQNVICSEASLQAQVSRSFGVTLTVNENFACDTDLTHEQLIASAATEWFDPEPLNNTSDAVFMNVTCPVQTDSQLSISVTDNRNTAHRGDIVNYHITVRNNGTTRVEDIEVIDDLPGTLSFLSGDPTPTESNHGQRAIWKLSLDAGKSKTLLLQTRVNNNAGIDTVMSNTAFIHNQEHIRAVDTTTVVKEDGDDDDDDQDDDDDDDDNGSSGSSRHDDIEITVRSSASSIDPQCQDRLRYTIRIRNETSQRRVDLRAELDRDTYLLFASDDGKLEGNNTVEWEDLRIEPDGVTNVTVEVRVRPTARDNQDLQFRAEIDDENDVARTRIVQRDGCGGAAIAPLPAGGEALHGDSQDLALLTVEEQANRKESQPGSLVQYSITVRNPSANPARNVKVVATFDTRAVSIEHTGGGTVTGNTITWTVPVIAADGMHVLRYSAKIGQTVAHGTTVKNSVAVEQGPTHRAAKDSVSVRIISQLPQTGLLSFAREAQGSRTLLRSPRGAANSSSNGAASAPAVVWVLVTITGMAGGGYAGRKWLFV